MKKIFTAILLIFMMSVSCLLSACSLVTVNNTKYLKQVVAQTDGVKITMEDLILGYNSFGYQYVQSGQTEEEAVKKTLEGLIDRELLYNKAKLQIGELSISKQNEIYKEIFDGINSQIKEYVDEIVKTEGLEIPKVDEAEEESKSATFTPYEKKVIREFNAETENYEYKRVIEDEEENDTELISFTLDEYGISGLAQRGYSKYINKVKKSRDEYKNLKDTEVFEKEVKRIYNIYEKNKYLEIFQQNYENNMEIKLDKVVEKYIELVKNNAYTYTESNMSNYNSKMQNSANEIYYQPFGDKYIQVAHILLKYSDKQSKEIKALETKLNQNLIDPENYEIQVQKIAQQIVSKAKVDGKETGEAKSYLQIFNEVKSAVESKATNEDKLAEFIKMIEKYNQDDGMMDALNSQTQYYTVNLDTQVTDTMVKPFADASREMYSKDGSKDYTIYATPVLSEYGYHIIFSLGTVKGYESIQNIDSVSLSYLYETEAMKGTNKSLFDKMLEIVDKSEYTTYQNNLVSGLREGLTIKYNKTAYQRLYKK